MGGQLLHVHSPEASTAPALGAITRSECIEESIRYPGQNAVVARRTACSRSPTAAQLWAQMAHVWTSHTLGQARHSWQPLPGSCAAPCSIGERLCITCSRKSPASAIPCTVQRCGQCRSPARLCPAGSPGSSHRFLYPGSASTGHTSPAGRRGERVSA